MVFCGGSGKGRPCHRGCPMHALAWCVLAALHVLLRLQAGARWRASAEFMAEASVGRLTMSGWPVGLLRNTMCLVWRPSLAALLAALLAGATASELSPLRRRSHLCKFPKLHSSCPGW